MYAFLNHSRGPSEEHSSQKQKERNVSEKQIEDARAKRRVREGKRSRDGTGLAYGSNEVVLIPFLSLESSRSPSRCQRPSASTRSTD